jgi:asparagine synthase (glutamine-hydrolysing)
MCGIAGLLDLAGADRETLLGTAGAMTAALRRRGPDGAGVWVDARAGIALGHRRLAVVELSEAGRQPMHSACGRYVLVFNGEIYNYQALRKELQDRGHAFRGGSDTEVLLAAIVEWGMENALSQAAGMWALAIWDRREWVLYLARDRVGEKPLYYGRAGSAFVFGSELSALEQHPAGLGDIDAGALAAYLRFAYVPAPYSIYSRFRKLPAGSMLKIDTEARCSEPVRYWALERVARAGIENPLRCGTREATEQAHAVLDEAVRLQTAADVPVGAFLSGGIDSSMIVSLMCRHASRVRTFTIGFADRVFNEADHARAVARHLGTEHTELQVTPSDAMAAIPKIPEIYSEPFGDSSQIPAFLVSELTRRYVTVALSGDGGDEVFGGYDRYGWANSIWCGIRRLPHGGRKLLARAMTSFPPSAMNFAARGQHRLGDRLHKLAGLIEAANAGDLYMRLVSQWLDPASVLERGTEPSTFLGEQARDPALSDFRQQLMFLDAMTYLPDDILVKVDRAAMANSLETRAPFLDHRVIEFAWRLPFDYKVRNGRRKWLLRQVLHRYVPPALADHPKSGFAIPIASWLREPLRAWAEELLEERRLESGGLFRAAPIRHKWREHLAGKRNWAPALWTVLMLQAWHARQRSRTKARFSCDFETAASI